MDLGFTKVFGTAPVFLSISLTPGSRRQGKKHRLPLLPRDELACMWPEVATTARCGHRWGGAGSVGLGRAWAMASTARGWPGLGEGGAGRGKKTG